MSIPRIAILWWESVKLGWGTVGDLLAVHNLTNQILDRGGVEVDIIWDLPWPYWGIQTRPLSEALNLKYDVAIFVCGPLVDSIPFLELLDSFPCNTLLAAGVSIVKGNEAALNKFDDIYIRDSLDVVNFDFALDSRWINHKAADLNLHQDKIGLILVNDQAEYGVNSTKHNLTKEFFYSIDGIDKKNIINITTQFPLTSGNIESFFDDLNGVSVVLTNRMHGALLSILCERPVIAIDQVVAGGKVSSLINKIKYPYVYSINNLSLEKLNLAFYQCKNNNFIEDLKIIKKNAQLCSQKAVTNASELVFKYI